jgi:hypothetical protein
MNHDTVNAGGEPPWWTTTKLAEAAGVDPSNIRHLLAHGTLQGYKLGREWLIEPDEAERYLQLRRRHGRLPPNAKTATPEAPQSEEN